MFPAVENDVFPYFVADRHSIMERAESCQQLEVPARIDDRGGVQRIVEKNSLGLPVKDSLQRLLREPPVRRFKSHQARDPSRLTNKLKIGVVNPLGDDHPR